jgi:hypothetical protein
MVHACSSQGHHRFIACPLGKGTVVLLGEGGRSFHPCRCAACMTLHPHPPLPPGASARREKSETRRLPPPHSDLNRRPADFWREAIFKPFHHGTLLAKIRRRGFSTASGPQSIGGNPSEIRDRMLIKGQWSLGLGRNVPVRPRNHGSTNRNFVLSALLR